MDTTRVLYCCRCGLPLLLAGLRAPVPCECGGTHYGDEPPLRKRIPLVWTGEDLSFLRSLRICVEATADE
jgi:hypothetical protein